MILHAQARKLVAFRVPFVILRDSVAVLTGRKKISVTFGNELFGFSEKFLDGCQFSHGPRSVALRGALDLRARVHDERTVYNHRLMYGVAH